MTATKPATALPWAAVCIGSETDPLVVAGFPDLVDVFDIGPVNANGETMVRVATTYGPDAAFIVAAVNAHADLVDLLRQAAALLELHKRPRGEALARDIRAALAKAGAP